MNVIRKEKVLSMAIGIYWNNGFIDVGSSNVNIKTVDWSRLLSCCLIPCGVMPPGLGSPFIPILEALYDIDVVVINLCSCEW